MKNSYRTRIKGDDLMTSIINGSMELVKETPFGECWKWHNLKDVNSGDGQMYCVVYDNFEKWFSTNSMNIANKYIEPNQLSLFSTDDFTETEEDLSDEPIFPLTNG